MKRKGISVEEAIALVPVDRLQDAAISDVVGEFVKLRLGELGARVVRVFVEAIDANHQWAAITVRHDGRWRCRRGDARGRGLSSIAFRLRGDWLLDTIQQIELVRLLLAPQHAHGAIVPRPLAARK